MEKVVRRFASHEDADRADREEYRAMTPAERLDVLLELIARHNEATTVVGGNAVA